MLKFPKLNKTQMLESGIERQVRTLDRVVILEHDGQLCEILDVEDINEERIAVPFHSIPWQDVKTYMSPEGRVFVLNAPEEYIKETKHLATVEQATVISHAVQYQRLRPEKFDFMKMLPWIVMVVMAIGLMVKK